MAGRTPADSWSPPDEARDLELMGRLQSGDPSALDALVELYWPRLVAYVDKLLGSIDAAEDVVQSAFVRLWEARASWKPTGAPHAYLYRIARNLALDERKWRRVRKSWLKRERAWSRAAPSPEVIAMDLELAVAMKQAIETLPERRREVFTLARLHDLSYREVAEIMGISTATVANQLALCLAHLRQALQPFYDGPRVQAGRSVAPSSRPPSTDRRVEPPPAQSR